MAAKKILDSSVRGQRIEKKKNVIKRQKIDFSDIPELSDEQLASMRRVGRPPLGDEARRLIAIRLDPKVLNWLRDSAAKRHVPYQSLINDILAREMKAS